MRINLVRSVGITVGIIAILLVAPTVCAASMDMMMDMTAETHTLVPQCSSTSDSPLSHHILMNAVGEQVTPNRFIPHEEVCLSWSPADLTVEPSPTEERPVQWDVRDHTPISIPIAYHCRNHITSEEPPL